MLTTPFSSCAPNFQEDNGLPVHLKGGATDNILYRVTMTLCLGGVLQGQARPELREKAAGLEMERGRGGFWR